MQYLGGKARISKYIAAYINAIRRPGQAYIEPFVGAGWVLAQMNNNVPGLHFASDANADLIAMWVALQQGWIPPGEVSEEEYQRAKNEPQTPAYLRAFIAIGCSYSGKWFGGYARNKRGDNYALSAKNSLLRIVEKVSYPSVIFQSRDYREINFEDTLIYCDPPYVDTTSYGATGALDTQEFWEYMRLWSRNNIVVVSEYKAPDDFRCVLEIPTKLDMRNRSGERASRLEKLFIHQSLLRSMGMTNS